MQSPLWVGISPLELEHDEIFYNHYGTVAKKDKQHLNETESLYC